MRANVIELSLEALAESTMRSAQYARKSQLSGENGR
jgi:hypothetical protein